MTPSPAWNRTKLVRLTSIGGRSLLLVGGLALASAIGIAVPLAGERGGVSLGMGVALLMVVGIGAATPALLYISLVLVMAASVDAARAVSLAPELTASGAVTILMTALGLVIIAAVRPSRTAWRIAGPLVVLVVVGLMWQVRGVTVPGMQAVVVLVLLAETLLVTSAAAVRQPIACVRIVDLGLTVGGSVVGLGYVAQTLAGDSLSLFGPRSAAAFLSICLAWTAGRWSTGTRRYGYLSLFFAAVIGLSLSRTALGAALVTLAAARLMGRSSGAPLGRRRIAQFVLAVILASGVMVVLVRTVDPLRDRFNAGDVVTAEGVKVNVMGRDEAWVLTWRSAMSSPWLGQGPGSASVLIDAHLPGLGHPHSDYLRLLHDYGLLGVAAWLAFLVRSLGSAVSHVRPAASSVDLNVPRSASLVVMTLSLLMLTDNVLVYAFVSGPSAVVLGLAAGLRDRPTVLAHGGHSAARRSAPGRIQRA